MKRLFHYTTASRAVKIMAAQQINVAIIGVSDGERPVVWASFHPNWEPTATPALGGPNGERDNLTFADLPAIDTPIRFEVRHESAPLDWRTWLKTSGVDRRHAKSLELVAIRQGATTDDWRMSFAPIVQKDWIAIESFSWNQWMPIEQIWPADKRDAPWFNR